MLKSEVESRRVSNGHRCLVTLSQLVIVVLLSLSTFCRAGSGAKLQGEKADHSSRA